MSEARSFEDVLSAALQAGAAGNGDLALSYLREAAVLAPTSALPHFMMGAEYAQAGNRAAAEMSYAQALLLAPEMHIARFQLGLLQYTDLRVAMALLTWQPLISVAEPNALSQFALAFQALAVDDFAAARAALVEGLALPLDNAPLIADMQQLLARIQAQYGSSQQTGRPQGAGTDTSPAPVPAKSPEPERESTSDAMHVLLAGYRGNGSVH